jgi:hypothetical protein
MGFEATDQRLRREIFTLGGRHRGDPLAGALRELQEDGLSTERRMLLRAVVRHLSPGTRDAATPDEGSARRTDWMSWAIIGAAGLAGAIQVLRLIS